jgi:hypothetical protein
MVGLCLLCQGKGHGLRDCRRVDFRKGSCCVSCGFPQTAFKERIHGNKMTGECESGLRDLMKGACWGVFRDVKLKEKYLSGIGAEVDSEEGYKKWLVKLDTSGEMINGCRLMLDIWRDWEGIF